MFTHLLRRVEGNINKNFKGIVRKTKKQYKKLVKRVTCKSLEKLVFSSLVVNMIGCSTVFALTSVGVSQPVETANPWVTEMKLDTTQASLLVLPEKSVAIKVEPKVEPKPVVKRSTVSRERNTVATLSVNTVPDSEIKQYAKRRSDELFGEGHYPALEALWMRESGWNARSTNRSSGACGIPQANPCSKAGGEYRTNPYAQVEWGLKYIAHRYKNPSNAWRFWLARHWY